MIVRAERATLRSGRQVEAAVIRAPDPEWAGRIEAMLGHKGDPWNWQNTEILRQDLRLEARFYVLHREGQAFANIMIAEAGGVGLLGHVWTAEADRGLGASSLLMELALSDFDQRGGRALFLGTAFDSAPWQYYRRKGFEPVETGSGYMARVAPGEKDFYGRWFRTASAEVAPLDWPDWPGSAPLFLGPFPGVVRIAAGRLHGRRSPEGPLLSFLRGNGSSRVLRAAGGAAVLAFAGAVPDPVWPETLLVDLYCHPLWWHRAGELLAALPPSPLRTIAYADTDASAKRQVLEKAGFRAGALLPHWAPSDPAGSRLADVVVYTR